MFLEVQTLLLIGFSEIFVPKHSQLLGFTNFILCKFLSLKDQITKQKQKITTVSTWSYQFILCYLFFSMFVRMSCFFFVSRFLNTNKSEPDQVEHEEEYLSCSLTWLNYLLLSRETFLDFKQFGIVKEELKCGIVKVCLKCLFGIKPYIVYKTIHGIHSIKFVSFKTAVN